MKGYPFLSIWEKVIMSEPESPLNILTIDGSDFQGQPSLHILSKLMKTINENRKVGETAATQKHLRPCDVFDVIGGVGIGGWLALLLGVFQMSIRECMNEYIEITQAIIRPDNLNEKIKKKYRGSEYDMEMLRTHVNRIAEEYKIGQYCLQEHRRVARCTRSFVVARYRDSARPEMQNCIFRTYRADGVKDPNILYPDPETTLLSDAFAGTAAMKGCLYPFKLAPHSGDFGSDTFRGCFTNATTHALDQMSRLSEHQGQNCRVSALVNIAPPVPSAADLYKIKHQGSWASVSSKSSNGSNNSERDSEIRGGKENRGLFRRQARSRSPRLNCTVVDNGNSNGSGNALIPITDSGTNGRNRSTSLNPRTDSRKNRRVWKWREFPIIRRSFRTQKYEDMQKSLQKDRMEHVKETKVRLQKIDPDALYVPLAPTNAPEKTALNDASTLPKARSNIDEYLKVPEVQEKLAKAAAHILRSYGANEASTARRDFS